MVSGRIRVDWVERAPESKLPVEPCLQLRQVVSVKLSLVCTNLYLYLNEYLYFYLYLYLYKLPVEPCLQLRQVVALESAAGETQSRWNLVSVSVISRPESPWLNPAWDWSQNFYPSIVSGVNFYKWLPEIHWKHGRWWNSQSLSEIWFWVWNLF